MDGQLGIRNCTLSLLMDSRIAAEALTLKNKAKQLKNMFLKDTHLNKLAAKKSKFGCFTQPFKFLWSVKA